MKAFSQLSMDKLAIGLCVLMVAILTAFNWLRLERMEKREDDQRYDRNRIGLLESRIEELENTLTNRAKPKALWPGPR